MSVSVERQNMKEALQEKILFALKGGPMTFGGLVREVLVATPAGSDRIVDRAVQRLRKSGEIKLDSFRCWVLVEPPEECSEPA